MRHRILFAVVAAAVALVVILGLRGLGEESPEKAIYALAHDLEHEQAPGHVPSMRSEADERVLTDRGRREAEEWRRLGGEGA